MLDYLAGNFSRPYLESGLVTQCAAVNTASFATREPPHLNVISLPSNV